MLRQAFILPASENYYLPRKAAKMPQNRKRRNTKILPKTRGFLFVFLFASLRGFSVFAVSMQFFKALS
jgi:hypothetical protein